MNRRQGTRFAVAAALLGLLVLSGTALAAQDELKGGSVVLQLRGSHGLKLKPSSLTLPIASGKVDPITGEGTVAATGSFKVRSGKGKAKVTITGLTFGASGGPGSIAASVGKKKVAAFGTLSGGTTTRAGYGAQLSGITAKLGSKGAKTLNGALSPKKKGKGRASSAGGGGKIKAGLPLGTVTATTDPKTVEVLPGGSMTLHSPMALITKLQAHCIDGLDLVNPGVAPIAPATQNLTDFTFPVTGGAVAPDFSDGKVITGGGQKVTKNNSAAVLVLYPACGMAAPPVGTVVTQSNYATDFKANALTADAQLPTGLLSAGVGAINYATGTKTFNPSTNQITITGATVTLLDGAALALNTVFPNESGNPSNDFTSADVLATLDLTATIR